MDRAGALLGSDVVGVDAEDAAERNGLLEGGVLQPVAGKDCDDVGLRCRLGRGSSRSSDDSA